MSASAAMLRVGAQRLVDRSADSHGAELQADAAEALAVLLQVCLAGTPGSPVEHLAEAPVIGARGDDFVGHLERGLVAGDVDVPGEQGPLQHGEDSHGPDPTRCGSTLSMVAKGNSLQSERFHL